MGVRLDVAVDRAVFQSREIFDPKSSRAEEMMRIKSVGDLMGMPVSGNRR
jgi:hypothetical protein